MEKTDLHEEMNMNYKQRVVLIIGAVALLYFLFTAPRISIVKGTYVTPQPDKKEIAKIVDVSTALTRAFAVLGATLLVSIALRDKKGARTEPRMDREDIVEGHCQEGNRQPAKKEIFAKIIKFLKDFF